MSELTDEARARYHAGLIAEGMEGVEEYAADGRLPAHLAYGLRMYLSHRDATGGFLRHVLENDFARAIANAHTTLGMRDLKALNELIQGTFPSNCHGSPEAVAKWLAEGEEGFRA